MIMPTPKYYECIKCDMLVVLECDVEEKTEMTFSGHLVKVAYHKQCGEQVKETKLWG